MASAETITAACERLMSDCPLHCETYGLDILFVVKLFDIAWGGTWYLSEYDPSEKVAFGYVEGLSPDPDCDEWGYFSVEELEELRWNGIPRIERDIHFEPTRFQDLDIRARA